MLGGNKLLRNMKFFMVLIIRGKEDSIRTKLGDEKLTFTSSIWRKRNPF